MEKFLLSRNAVKERINIYCENELKYFTSSQKDYYEELDEKLERYEVILKEGKHDEFSISFLNSLTEIEIAYFKFKQAEKEFRKIACNVLNSHTNAISTLNGCIEILSQKLPFVSWGNLEALGYTTIDGVLFEKYVDIRKYLIDAVYNCQSKQAVQVDNDKLKRAKMFINNYIKLSNGASEEEAREKLLPAIEMFMLTENDIIALLHDYNIIKVENRDTSKTFRFAEHIVEKPNIEDIMKSISNSAERDYKAHINMLSSSMQDTFHSLQTNRKKQKKYKKTSPLLLTLQTKEKQLCDDFFSLANERRLYKQKLKELNK